MVPKCPSNVAGFWRKIRRNSRYYRLKDLKSSP